MFAAVGELLADEADAVQVSPHGKLFVLGLRLLGRCAFLRQGLVVEGQGQDNVASDLPRVELAVEAPQFHRVVAREKAVQV